METFDPLKKIEPIKTGKQVLDDIDFSKFDGVFKAKIGTDLENTLTELSKRWDENKIDDESFWLAFTAHCVKNFKWEVNDWYISIKTRKTYRLKAILEMYRKSLIKTETTP
jgi:hypothetical protein